jgi:hypothetical protein
MSTATTTSHDTGQASSRRTTTQPTNTPTSQLERNAANRLRATMAAVKLSFTWLGVRKTLAPEQRTTAARAFHADRELLTASKLILDTKNPAYRAVAAVRSEASSYWRTVTLPFDEFRMGTTAAAVVPEPAAAILALVGLAVGGYSMRYRRHRCFRSRPRFAQ